MGLYELAPYRQTLAMSIQHIKKFNSSRTRLYRENEAFARTIPAGSMVLDAGAGSAPYKHLVSHANYESADFEMVDKAYAKSTYVCDLRNIPVEEGRYDFVLFNQVMEHLPDPRSVLNELFRVMKPGGRLIYSGPLFYEEHEQPYDFFRYTSFGVNLLFKEAGFIIQRLDWLEGYFGTVAYQMNRMGQFLPARPSSIAGGLTGLILCPFMLLLKGQMLALSLVFHWLETRTKFTARGYPKNYVAVVVKPS